MASVSAIRSHINQENAQQPLNVKSGALGRSFGPVKTFQANNTNAPQATPRRALGDLGNTFRTPGNTTKKNTGLKHSQLQNLKSAKTPGLNRMSQATPRGKDLLKHIGSMSVKTSKKPAFQISADVETMKKSSVPDRDLFERENMHPFVDKDEDLPRSSSMDFILQNVSKLYQGCLYSTPYFASSAALDLDRETPKMDIPAFESISRPEEDSSCMLPVFDDFSELYPDFKDDFLDIELPPVDTDLSGLGLP